MLNKKLNMGKKVTWPRSRDLLSILKTLLFLFRMKLQSTDVKFCRRIEGKE